MTMVCKMIFLSHFDKKKVLNVKIPNACHGRTAGQVLLGDKTLGCTHSELLEDGPKEPRIASLPWAVAPVDGLSLSSLPPAPASGIPFAFYLAHTR